MVSSVLFLAFAVAAHAQVVDQKLVISGNVSDAPGVEIMEPFLVFHKNGDVDIPRGVLVPGASPEQLQVRDAVDIEIDDNGNGTIESNERIEGVNVDEFYVKYDGEVVARLEKNLGNFYIKGSLVLFDEETEIELDLDPSMDHREFVVIDKLLALPEDQVRILIDRAGNLKIKGQIYNAPVLKFVAGDVNSMVAFGDSVMVAWGANWSPFPGTFADFSTSAPDLTIQSVIDVIVDLLTGDPALPGQKWHSFATGYPYPEPSENIPDDNDRVVSHAEQIARLNQNFEASEARNYGQGGTTYSSLGAQISQAKSANPSVKFDYAVIYFGGNEICGRAPNQIDTTFINTMKEYLRLGIEDLKSNNDWVDSNGVQHRIDIAVMSIPNFPNLYDIVKRYTEQEGLSPGKGYANFCFDWVWPDNNDPGLMGFFVASNYCNAFLTQAVPTGDGLRTRTRTNIVAMNSALRATCNAPGVENVLFVDAIADEFFPALPVEPPDYDVNDVFNIRDMSIDCIHPALPAQARWAEKSWTEISSNALFR